MDEAPMFRAVKRKKHAHKQEAPDLTTELDDETPLQVIKLRTLPRARPKGVQFSNQKAMINESDDAIINSTALTQQSSEPNSHYGINNRFVGSTTGQVVNADKHMMAYVDQQMAKKQPTVSSTSSTVSHKHTNSQHRPPENHDDYDTSSSTDISNDVSSPPPPLPPSTHHNGPSIASTTSSFQPLAEVDLTTTVPSWTTTTAPKASRRKGPRRPRLGRDGKPLRPRPRKRRDSSDITRDGLVEQVLHETAPYGPSSSTVATTTAVTVTNRTGGSSMTATTTATAAAGAGAEEVPAQQQRQGNNEALDEKMAADFQRQFLDAASERRQMQQNRHSSSNSNNSAKTKAGSGSGGAGGASSLLTQHGPRLGGSRSVRARIMAAAQAAAAAEGHNNDK